MPSDLISKKTRYEFREFLVGWTLREIEIEFDAADVECDKDFIPSCTGQRRSLVEQYYYTVDWTSAGDVRKVLSAYEDILNSASDEDAANLSKWLRRDGFVFQNGRIRPIAGTKILDEMKSVAVQFDAEHLSDHIRRIEASVEEDPALAIGSAKELVETCCKIILEERGVDASATYDLPKLTKLTLKELRLLPQDIPDTSKGYTTIKRTLSNLASVASGIGELRNLYGTGHGKGGRARGLGPRHARLAVGAATTLTLFLFETFQAGKKKST